MLSDRDPRQAALVLEQWHAADVICAQSRVVLWHDRKMLPKFSIRASQTFELIVELEIFQESAVRANVCKYFFPPEC